MVRKKIKKVTKKEKAAAKEAKAELFKFFQKWGKKWSSKLRIQSSYSILLYPIESEDCFDGEYCDYINNIETYDYIIGQLIYYRNLKEFDCNAAHFKVK